MNWDRAVAPKLYVGEEKVETELYQFAGGVTAVYSSRCPGKETPNEDAAALLPIDDTSGILVVADGVGGSRAGHQAAGIIVQSLRSALEEMPGDDAILRTAILNGIEHANRSILELAIGAASTLAVVEIQNRVVRPYHVGDSMILVLGQRGKIKLQTVSHSPVGFAVEAGVLDEAEAMHHEERHLVSNLMGTHDMRIEIGSTLKLAPRDTLLLASDGLFDNLHVAEIVDRIRTGPLDEAIGQMAADSIRRMSHPEQGFPSKPDDMTVVSFRPTPHVRRRPGTRSSRNRRPTATTPLKRRAS